MNCEHKTSEVAALGSDHECQIRQASRDGVGTDYRKRAFGWHRFRHSLSTWANETTKDITVSQTMRRHSKPDTTAIYTHGNFGKALDAQRLYMDQLLKMKPASESTR